MAGVAVINSGDYQLNIDTGFPQDAFILDSAIAGILGGYGTIQEARNILINPNFEFTSNPGADWTGSGGTRTTLTTDPYSGTYYLNFASTTAANLSLVYPVGYGTGTTRVSNGDVFRVSAYFKNIAGLDRGFYIIAQPLLENGNAGGSTGLIANQTLTVGSGWTLLEGTYTYNQGASYPYLRFEFHNQWLSAQRSLSNVMGLDAVCVTMTSATRPYFDGTYSNPYTGYTVMTQSWEGPTNNSPSNIEWGLDSSYVNSDYTLDGTTGFANVMDSTTNIVVRRGREDVGDQFSSGTMSFTIQDTSGVFNPFDENSPFYDQNQNIPGLAPLRQVNLKRYDSTNTLQTLFSGYVVNYDYNFELGGLDTVTVYCADQFYLLSQTEMNALNPTAQTSGQRITTVLNLPEINYPASPRNIATGTVNLGHDSAYDVPAGTNALSYLTQINDTAEFGRIFMSRDGTITFQERLLGSIELPIASFKDDGTAYDYDGIGISFEADQVVNRVVVTGLNGTSSIANDTASQTEYFIQNESIGNSLLHDATEIATAATYLLNAQPEARYTNVATQFLMLTSAQRDVLAVADIGDSILVSKTFPSGTGTTTLAQTLAIEGINHHINFNTGHKITFFTSPTIILHELILDDATYGTIDTTNALR